MWRGMSSRICWPEPVDLLTERVSMLDSTRQALHRLVSSGTEPEYAIHGLSDLCPGAKAEIRILKDGMDYLSRLTAVPQATTLLLSTTATLMAKETGRSLEQCRWAIETWAIALGRLKESDVAS